MTSILIIGGGVAGLSTGCYGQMNGFQTRVLEQHFVPGGVCTSWRRGGYTFDGCIHWLVGSKTGSSMNRIWQELGALQGRQVVDHEVFIRVEGEGGKAFILYTDIDRLERRIAGLQVELHSISREHDKASRERARQVQDQIDELQGELDELTKRWHRERDVIEALREIDTLDCVMAPTVFMRAF